MEPADFNPDLSVNAFQNGLDWLCNYFYNRCGNDVVERVYEQVFQNEPIDDPLFKIFCTNSANRTGAPDIKTHHWNALAELFHDWDAHLFLNAYPIIEETPTAELRHAFVDLNNGLDLDDQFIRGNIEYHINALNGNIQSNGYVRILTAIQQGSCLFNVEDVEGNLLEGVDLMINICNDIDLHEVELQDLTQECLWEATENLVGIGEIGRQLALNFIKDAGYGNAFKPDVHTRRVAGYAFRQNPAPYERDDLEACVSASIAFAQVISEQAANWNGWEMSLAAVDRLMWTAGSGILWVGEPQIPRRYGGRNRAQTLGEILRHSVLPGHFDN